MCRRVCRFPAVPVSGWGVVVAAAESAPSTAPPAPVQLVSPVGALPSWLALFAPVDGVPAEFEALLVGGVPGEWAGQLRTGAQVWDVSARVVGRDAVVEAVAVSAPSVAWTQEMVDVLSEGVFVLDASATVVWANRAAAELLGFVSPLDAEGRGADDQVWSVTGVDGRVLAPEDWVGVRALASRLPVGPEVIAVANVATGERVWLSTSARPCLLPDGSPGAVSSFADVSPQHEAHAAQQRQRELLELVLRSLLEAAGLFAPVTSRDGQVVDLELLWLSPAAGRLFDDPVPPARVSTLLPRSSLAGLLDLVAAATDAGGCVERRFDFPGLNPLGLAVPVDHGTVRVSVTDRYVVVALVDDTERASAATRAADREAQLLGVLDTLHESLLVLDGDGRPLLQSGKLAAAEASTWVGPDGERLPEARLPQRRVLSGEVLDGELVALQDRSGRLQPFRVNGRPLESGAVLSFADVSSTLAALDSLSSVRAQLQLALEHIPFPVTFWSRSEDRFELQVANGPARKVQAAVDADAAGSSGLVERILGDLQVAAQSGPVTKTVRVGDPVEVWRYTVAVRDTHAVVVAVDLTEVSSQTDRLLWLTTHHDRSRLLNLPGFVEQVAQRAAESGSFAVVWLSLTEFDDITETFGFATSSSAVAEVVERVERLLPPGASLAQPDDPGSLAVLLPEVASLVQADEWAYQMASAVSAPVVAHAVALLCAPAVGVAVGPLHGVDAPTLLQRAKTASSEARRLRVLSHRWSPQVAVRQLTKTGLLADVQPGLERGEFEVVFQPQVSVSSGVLAAAQLRLRWRHPSRGVIPAGEFLPLLASTSWLRPLLLGALRESLVRWPELVAVCPGVRLVHALPMGLLAGHRFVDELAELLVESGASPQWLDVEVSERDLAPMSAVDRVESFERVVARLTQLPVAVSLGSYGAGFASFFNVHRFPLREARLDRGFARALARDARLQVAVRSLVEVAHACGVSTVATGVESDADVDVLVKLGCDLLQGYALSRPVPFDELLQAVSPTPGRFGVAGGGVSARAVSPVRWGSAGSSGVHV